jgi:mRNA-degrading endonuclease RelE of RelBE toxin-antitoxin system
MSEKIIRLWNEIRAFVTVFFGSLDREKRFALYATPTFERDFEDAAKKHPGMFADFTSFIRTFDPDRPLRGRNIEGTGANKTEMKKNRRSGAYRIMYYFEPASRVVVLLMMYPKNVKDNLDANEIKALRRAVEKIKSGEITLSSLFLNP